MATTTQSHDTSFVHNNDNHLEMFSLIWLDANINIQKNQVAQEKLRAIINHIKTFHDVEECKNYIEQTPGDDRLVFLVNGQLGRQIVPSIHQLQQVSAIYILSEDKNSDKKWAHTFSKVKGVSVELDELILRIKEDDRIRRDVEEVLSINMYTARGEDGESTTGINGRFVYSQLLIDCLLQLKSNEVDKNELVACCEKEYEGNQPGLNTIQEFQDKYSPDMALSWYTRNSFFYKTLNAALRKQNIDMIVLYRSYISDICRQLQVDQPTHPVRVYRSQLMSSAELGHLRKNTGQFISINSFLSTTINREVAYMYMAGTTQQTNFERILFVIDADPKVVKTKPFADITKFSPFPQESEVLFMLGSIFRINSINRDNDQVWIMRMSLCGDDEHSLKSVLERMKKRHNIQNTNLHTVGRVLWKMGNLALAKKYYIRYISELPDDDPSLQTVYQDLTDITSQQGDYDASIQWYQKLHPDKIAIAAVVSISVGVVGPLLGTVCAGIIVVLAYICYQEILEWNNTTSDVDRTNNYFGIIERLIQMKDHVYRSYHTSDVDRTNNYFGIIERLIQMKDHVYRSYHIVLRRRRDSERVQSDDTSRSVIDPENNSTEPDDIKKKSRNT